MVIVLLGQLPYGRNVLMADDRPRSPVASTCRTWETRAGRSAFPRCASPTCTARQTCGRQPDFPPSAGSVFAHTDATVKRARELDALDIRIPLRPRAGDSPKMASSWTRASDSPRQTRVAERPQSSSGARSTSANLVGDTMLTTAIYKTSRDGNGRPRHHGGTGRVRVVGARGD